MRLGQNLLQHGAAGGGGGILVDDVFSTDIYTGNGTGQAITNGIDLAGDGGLVWIKCRSNSLTSNHLFDDERGTIYRLRSDSISDQNLSGEGRFPTYANSGFFLGLDSGGEINFSGRTYASWTFRKAARFFDVVIYTGTETLQSIPHNLGIEPGLIIAKRIDASASWGVYHRAKGFSDYAFLNTTSAFRPASTVWGAAPTSSAFSVGSSGTINSSGGTYVAYIFAHDTEADGVVQCGSYVGNGSSTGPVVDLGWEPQWLLIKRASSTGDWIIHDNARDTVNPRTAYLEPNTRNAETTGLGVDFTSTGFQIKDSGSDVNASGNIHVYIAIRAEEA